MKINTPEEMIELGRSLAKDHKILLLQGDLGAGKTLLIKGFAKGLGIDENIVQSPTYAYLNVYENKLNRQRDDGKEVSLDDGVMPTTGETVSSNEMKKLQISKAGRRKLLHIDMYRLQTHEELVHKGILAQIHDHEYIAIERPKFIEQLSLPGYTLITIKKLSETEREIEIIEK